MKHLVYRLIYVIPRTILNIISEIVYVLTLGFVSLDLYFKFWHDRHVKWAFKVMKRFDKG